MLVEAGFPGQLALAIAAVPGKGDQHAPFVGVQRARAPSYFEAVQSGQSDVEERKLWPRPFEFLEGAWSIVGERNVVPLEPEQQYEALRGVGMVVDHQNASFHGSAGAARREGTPYEVDVTVSRCSSRAARLACTASIDRSAVSSTV